MEARKSRRTKKPSRPLQLDQCALGEHNSRMTRSKYHSSQENSEIIPSEVQNGVTKYSNIEHSIACADTLRQRGQPSESKCCMLDSVCEINGAFNKMKCWYCLLLKPLNLGH